jgi:hypothetical protein
MIAVVVAVILAADGGTPAPAPRAVEATRFIHGSPAHGVPGPWALSGFRIGADALRRLGLTREQAFELEVVHRAVPQVQYTCMADGLMAATGASPGKMNLSVEKVKEESEIETVITHCRTGRQLVYRLKRAWRDTIRGVPYADFPKAALRLEATADAEVFTVEERTATK